MARIRTIKPEFWADEKISPMDPVTRLVFLGLVSHADDAGRLVDSVRMIDGLLFPYDESTSSGDSLETLARASRILRYTSKSGQPLIQIVGWEKHQRVDNPSKYVLPAPTPEDYEVQEFSESSRDPRESLARVSLSDHGPRTMDQRPTDSSKSDEPISDLWEKWIEMLGGNKPHPKLTTKRKKVLAALYREQLKSRDHPLALFENILKAVKRSDHHMSTRSYQMPESLFRNEDRRDRWVQEVVNPSKPKVGTEAHKVSQRPEPGRTYTPPRGVSDDGPRGDIAKVDARKLLESVGVRTPTQGAA